MKWLFAIFLFVSGHASSQHDTSLVKSYSGIQARLHYGFIFAHSEHVQNTSGAHPRGIEIERITQRADTSAWDLCHCYPIKGISLSYFDYNTPILGHAVTAAYFLEPAYRLGRKAQFRFRGGIGLSYLTNPFDAQHNPTNMSYSTSISGYLQLGAGIALQVARQWLVQAGAQYQHISNGGIKEPNKGINWPTASVGATWIPNTYRLPIYKSRNESRLKSKPYIEIGGWISARQVPAEDGSAPRAALGGIVAQIGKQVGRISALNGGIEMSYDHSLYQRLKFDSIDGSAFRAGILAGHEFLLGKFYFSQQLGVYVFSRSPYYTRLYHRWSLRYRLHDHLFLGFGLKAHKQVADFVDLRLFYRL